MQKRGVGVDNSDNLRVGKQMGRLNSTPFIAIVPLLLFPLRLIVRSLKAVFSKLAQVYRIAGAVLELLTIFLTRQKNSLVSKLFWGRGEIYKNFFRGGLIFALIGWVYISLLGGESLAKTYQAETNLIAMQKDFDVELGAAVVPIDKDRPRDSVQEYIVQGGDTLSLIAEKFDISIQTVKWSNGLTSDYIKPGQSLKILPVTGLLHKVRGGDTLASLASKYSASEQAIADVNWLDPPFILQEGQELMIPGGVIQAPAAPTQPAVPVTPTIPSSPPVSGTGTFIMPTSGYISQYYWRWHRAIDIASKAQPAVMAADSGRVIYSGWDSSGYGLTILIDHGNGFVTRYAHADALYVRTGQYVNRGEAIMLMGSTGRSTGRHLHFEVILNGVQQNPLAYL